MGEPTSPTPQSAGPSKDRLDSWKEIAEYLKRDVTTVQRWEKRESMPVHRHLHDRMGSVYAYRSDLDAWTRSRNVRTENRHGESAAGSTGESLWIAGVTAKYGKNRGALTALMVAMAVVTAGLASLALQQRGYFWRNPIADAHFQKLTDFGGVEQDAAVSRDGRFVAFLSDRDGTTDVWVTQVGSGDFHNLTHGVAPEIVNPSIRTLRFSPDGSFIVFWVREQNPPGETKIGIWAVSTLGGQPKPYMEGAAELDWSPDGSRVAYHTPGASDPMFVSRANRGAPSQLIFTAPVGLHSHFPLWSPDSEFIYFAQGTLPDRLDIWRIPAIGGSTEQITSQHTLASYPVMLDRKTLLYLAKDPDGSGPWLYGMNVDRRVPHRLTSGLDEYTSLAASADGQRLALTLANPRSTLWKLSLDEQPAKTPPTRIALTPANGLSPRLGPGYLLYVAATGTSEAIWKSVSGNDTELWERENAHILGSPAISPDGKKIVFSVQEHGSSSVYVMQADGSNTRILTSALALDGNPVWSPDGNSVTTAADEHGVPHLFRIPMDGRAPSALVSEYSLDPIWAPDGSYMLYSGPDIGTNFSVKAVTPQGAQYPLPTLNMTRGARHLALTNDGRYMVVLQGEIEHKNLWQIDLRTGAERQLTNLPADFDVGDFDVSPNGREVALERAQVHSDVVLVDLHKDR